MNLRRNERQWVCDVCGETAIPEPGHPCWDAGHAHRVVSEQVPRTIGRPEWRELFSPETDHDASTHLDVSPGHVGVEFESGHSRVDAYYCGEATDIRIGDLQFIVGRDRLSILRQHGPYPISEWTVVYDGALPKKGTA